MDFARLLPALLLLAPLPAIACTCGGNPPVPEAVAGSARVFLGTVTAIEPRDEFLQRVTFRVSEHFKGGPAGVRQVENHAYGALCGYPFQEGVQYVVYADGRDAALTTTSCSRTSVAMAGGDLDQLRAPAH